jgi:hypothetical protein
MYQELNKTTEQLKKSSMYLPPTTIQTFATNYGKVFGKQSNKKAKLLSKQAWSVKALQSLHDFTLRKSNLQETC